ncbi:MAG: hypothetical protein ACYCZR_12420, partial [Burkholderiales bacterium]
MTTRTTVIDSAEVFGSEGTLALQVRGYDVLRGALSAVEGSMTSVTYDQANYHAGQCVALAALDVDDKDLCEALAYQAGLMRGLIL